MRKHVIMGLSLALIASLSSHETAQAQEAPLATSGLNPVQISYLKASNGEAYDHFGCGGANTGHTGNSVTISRGGNTLAIGAPYESSGARGIDGEQSDNSAFASGAVYVFTRQGENWIQQAYVKASNTGATDLFGSSVVLSGDGNTLAVAAHFESSAATGINGDENDDSIPQAGAVYVFTRIGNTWSQQAYIKASNSEGGDLFGFSVGLSADGATLVASSYDEDGGTRVINGPDDNLRGASGALFVFEFDGGAWRETAYLKGSRSERTDQLGYAVAISDDGNTIAGGAGDEDCLLPGVNPPGCDNDSLEDIGANIWVGAAYVFVRQGNTWTEQAFVKASNPRPYNSYGVRLALSGDGDTLAVTAYLEDEATTGVHGSDPAPFLIVPNLDAWRERGSQADESGAVYLYTRVDGDWTQQAYVKASNAQSGDEFGSAVALSGDGKIMAVAAHSEDSSARGLNGDPADDSASDSGAVYMFGY